MRFLLGALAVLVLLTVLFSGALVLVLLWSLLCVLLLARLWIDHLAALLSVKRDFVDRAFAGEEVSVRLAVQNGSRLPVTWLEAREDVIPALRADEPPFAVFGLQGRGRWELTYTLRCHRRGAHPVGPLRLALGDPIGMVQRSLVVDEPRPLLVYPRVLPLARLGLPTTAALSTLRAHHSLYEDTAHIVGVRDYHPGDSLRRMHWLASARTGQLLVKQYQPAKARQTLIALNLDSHDYDAHWRQQAAETAIEVAASVAAHSIQRERQAVGFVTEAYDPAAGERRTLSVRVGGGESQLIELLEILARIELRGTGDFATALQAAALRTGRDTTVLIIVGRLTESVKEAAVAMAALGLVPAIVLIQPRPWLDGANVMPGVPILHVWQDNDLAVLE